ncbi:MAG: diguanylate cyclase, partial [Thiobacillus sp.]|nr:diguanylate cyclase [Thiobacillus sp.]
ETALNVLFDAVIQLDATGDLHFLNPAGATLLGLAAGGTDGTPAAWSFIDHATRAPLLATLLERARKEGLTRIPADARLINGHGVELEVEGSCQPLHDAQGRISGYLMQLRDVTEESEWRRQQPDLWDREPVSTLPGRGFLENRLNLALLNRRAGDLPMTYLEIRIAGIRTVYETAGEAAGDRLVRHLTALLHAQVRETDLIARMDQEVFAVLLNFCPAEVSRRIAGKIMASLDGFHFEWAGSGHITRAELGQVDVPPFDGSLDELLAAARSPRPS